MNAFLFRAATLAAGIVPRPIAAAVAWLGASVCWFVLGTQRRIVEQNLQFIAPGRLAHERRNLGRRTFRNLAACMLDLLRVPALNAAQLEAMLEWSGREHLDRALAHGRGAIVIGAHVGNFEIGGPAVAALGYPIYAYVEDQEIPPSMYRAYERCRSATGLRLIPLSEGARAGRRALADGAIVALLADRVISGAGCEVAFAHGRRIIPTGPAALARWSGAPVLFFYLVLNPAGTPRYVGAIEPVELDASLDADGALIAWTAARVSRLVSEYPDQWFVFQPEWLDHQG
ncbi:MAG: lysophospholipid acyltransferase family protein [Vicinamibacterales bacterium]